MPIDNGVLGYPHVTCGEYGIRVQVDTQKPFQGRVYIKNEVHRPECVWGNGEEFSSVIFIGSFFCSSSRYASDVHLRYQTVDIKATQQPRNVTPCASIITFRLFATVTC